MDYLLCVFLLCFVFLFIIQTSKVYCKKEYELYEFNYQKTLPLRGLMALLIIFHHVVCFLNSGANTTLLPFEDWGGPIVGVFFFISGYGSYASFKRKATSYLKDFWKTKWTKIVLPLLLFSIIYSFFSYFEGSFSLGDTFKRLQIGNPPLPFSWFVYDLLAYYGIIYLVAILKPNKMAWGVFILSCFYCILKLCLGWETVWYRSGLCFSIGCSYCCIEPIILRLIKKNVFLSIIVYSFVIIVSLFLVFSFGVEGVSGIIPKVIVNHLTPVLIIFLSYFIKSCDFSAMVFLGKYSFEIYLFHGIFLMYFLTYDFTLSQNGLLLLFLAVVSCTISFSLVWKKLYSIVIHFL